MSSYFDVDDRPPNVTWDMWKRFIGAAMLIIVMTTTAVASAVLLEIDEEIKIFQEASVPIPEVKEALDDVDPGSPQTILVLGSDKRYIDDVRKNPVRSDTMILVRLDPDKNATAVLSIPRDLKVDIPGFGTSKINSAYANGGPRLTVRTVRNLMKSTGRDFPIHHVVNVNFGGFQRAVNRLGCVYAEVDRRYFNDNNPPFASTANYSAIDLKPGYQKLCGEDALSFVRFRHLDNDFVRAARQQEFLRQAKEQIGLGKIFGDREELLRIFGRYTQTDIAEDNTAAILRLLKLAYESSKNPTREIRFRGDATEDGEYVTIDDDDLDTTVRQFLEVEASEDARVDPEGGAGTSTDTGTDTDTTITPDPTPGPKPKRLKTPKKGELATGLTMAVREGEDHVVDMATRTEPALPVYFPGARLATGGYISDTKVPGEAPLPRSYDIFDRNKQKFRAYRIVLSQGEDGQYYGVQGTTWPSPPILDNPTDQVRLADRTYQRFFDGSRIRLIAWRPKDGRRAYWVSNTLNQRLTNKQMMGIARSLRRIGQ